MEAEPIGDKGYNLLYEPLREAESIGDKGYNIHQ
jgi:hypothetical protein